MIGKWLDRDRYERRFKPGTSFREKKPGVNSPFYCVVASVGATRICIEEGHPNQRIQVGVEELVRDYAPFPGVCAPSIDLLDRETK